MSVDHPNFEILSFTVTCENGIMFKVPVKDTKSINIIIPENTIYQLTIHFRVKNKTLTDLRYMPEARFFGFVVKKRDVDIGSEFRPRDEPYEVTFEKDTTPKGLISRGSYKCLSTYYANGNVLFRVHWKLTVTRW